MSRGRFEPVPERAYIDCMTAQTERATRRSGKAAPKPEARRVPADRATEAKLEELIRSLDARIDAEQARAERVLAALA
jgi:hypothetical protein